MTAEISARGRQRAIGHEEYSLYSSLSEDELVQMAIEQSLADKTRGPTTAEATASTCVNRQPTHFYPWTRSTVPPENLSASGPKGLFQGVMQKYKNSQLAPVDPVLKAIKEGDEEALKAMIKAGKNLAEPNKEGWLPLHEAAYYGQLGCLKALQQAYPAVIDQRTLQEETALYLATCRGHLDCLLSLLQAGAEPDISNKSRETPLYKACERKNVEAVRILVQYNADTNHRCNRGWTALHESVSRNDLEVMEILVSRGAKVESKNAYGITPLFVAAQSGQLDALRFLAKYGADINTQASDNASALYEACKNEHEDVVEFLLSQGADANKANKDGLLPLHIASKKGNYRIVQMLLPVTSRTRVRRSGISPLHLAAERNHDGVLEALLGARFDVNAPLAPERARLYEDRRSSALYFAVVNNNVYATELLLLAGADPNRDLISPLLVAIRHGCLRTMQLLLDHGANIDAYIATHPTAFPATIMFAMKYLSLLKFLMDLGCDGEPCFSCLYGNGPHPPPPSRSNRFSDTPATEKGPSVVQFCEILSTPEVSRWAGPIIDVLLDYVGNVQLCSRLKEHIDSFEDWAVIKEKAELPRPLAHLCRLRVRKAVGKHRIKLLDALPLPGRLIRYLKYENTQ
ncbi:ankyrin repeat and SOCS box protein 2 isoform X1 [Ursus americanus]|uniref:Ankyrin repeat and SOCS box protein 2 n=3 Tax=Ursus TaxID=9639 RepID=A0A8M1H1L6_URSMA|nr:ankyrin repeat and SOCS box protein 2 [Ursus arctos]XP_026371169.1 ankyrin repeat and SOCS box protein 2 [Ursus arctos]XP_040497423.1 ankyrin repeat and SOCS box protein 2 isoform X1 [Ursus maritimus]XP_040497424.1 ankyrin repeat and SOCS box protein 2 isoform X1 [Ursus maritimus]XP_045671750.1 ankyrin repeat and SOCS box protein 2 isoform X1 [Ursus americanus]